jgi:hypothetical protein
VKVRKKERGLMERSGKEEGNRKQREVDRSKGTGKTERKRGIKKEGRRKER